MNHSQTELEALVRERAPQISQAIRQAADEARNEADLVAPVEDILQELGRLFEITLRPQRERTLINGRADAVYNRFVIEYEPPQSLRAAPTYGHNRHAVQQVKQYMDELERLDRHKKERLAGVVLDGSYYIFVRYRDDHWRVDDPIAVTPESTETFLRYLLSLATELALTPENLARDFGENSNVARLVVSTLYDALGCTDCAKVEMLFQQWQVQFSEITGWAKQSSDSRLARIVRNFGITERNPDLMRFFFAVHTYYATFIKLLAVQIAQYYMMPRFGSDLQQVASADSAELQRYLMRMERGGIFRELGINNFLEGDFFGWYLDIWDERLDRAARRIVSDLANYSLVTLDVDPEQTRDLLKKLYQDLMPRELRHALGEYYTPDWLAERLLNQLGYEGDPTKRLLDPACGSGTFLVLAIRRVREYVKAKMLPERVALEQILRNIVGFDLNPLAVISARTNYLLALGDLLKHRMTEISIPVYLADSVLTPSRGAELFTQNAFSFNTVVGRFSVPRTLVEAQYIDRLAQLLEESVESGLSHDQFRQRLLATFPLDAHRDEGEINIAIKLFDQLLHLHVNGIDGIWARIIKNAFAPLFVGKFDYVAGNPPWVNWANLPGDYRQDTAPLWRKYNLFTHTGLRARLGGAMDDISILMTYVALDRYLNENGRLGFVITQSVFKTEGGGQGFRRFHLPEDDISVRVIHVDDMSSFQPFDGATNRTSVVIFSKGQKTTYPVPYTIWHKSTRASVASDASLDEVLGLVKTRRWIAKPVNPGDVTSPWFTGKEKAYEGLRKALGQSEYQARMGVHCHGNGAYWLEVLAVRPDGAYVIANVPEAGRRRIESIQAAIESDFVYPLLRGRNVQQWRANHEYYILLPHDPARWNKAFPIDRMATEYPRTYMYLNHFKEFLETRSGYKQYFDPAVDPYYSLYNVGDYTLAPYKVVWRYIATDFISAVVHDASMPDGNRKTLIPETKLVLVPFSDPEEAHYMCACLSSSIAKLLIKSYVVNVQIATHIFNYLRVPSYDSTKRVHRQLAEASILAHELAVDRQELLGKVQRDIDELCSELWNLTSAELRDVQHNLTEISGTEDEPVADNE